VNLRSAALLVLLATAAASVVPCTPATAAAASLRSASAEGPPSLLPACHCGCKQRPSAAGTPTAPGFALLNAAVEFEPPSGITPLPAAPLLAMNVFTDPPEPVPLVVI
jgi:hypothetical protein